jgi:hypothetical protein
LREGNDTVTAGPQAGAHPTRKVRLAGVSLLLTASKGSDGMVGSANEAPAVPLKSWLHVATLAAAFAPKKFGRLKLPHSLSKEPDWVKSTVVRKSMA